MVPYVIEQNDNHALVRLTGDLTPELVPGLQADLKRLLEKGATDLLFDLEHTAMLNSSGIGLMIATANSLARVHGDMRIVNASPDILRLLQCMHLAARLHASGPSIKENHHG
jgi:anti-anti-sigma factor